jgi:hypothetical protein
MRRLEEGDASVFEASHGSAMTIANQRDTAGDPAGRGDASARATADWLCLAATPTFAIMALLTGVLGGGPLDALCSAAHQALPLNGMVLMYMLMSVFHSAPWLKLISGRRSGAQRSDPAFADRVVANLRRP